LEDEMYNYLFSVEEVNKLVQQGVPFRDAYKTVGKQIQDKTFSPQRKVSHTHEGSIGNLCLNEITAKMNSVF
jgi:argininosuccinate lyase